MICAIPPPVLSGSGSRVECSIGTPLSLATPGSPCMIILINVNLSITTVEYPVKQIRFSELVPNLFVFE